MRAFLLPRGSGFRGAFKFSDNVKQAKRRTAMSSPRGALSTDNDVTDILLPSEALRALEQARSEGSKFPELRKLVASWLSDRQRVPEPTVFVTSCIEIVFNMLEQEEKKSVDAAINEGNLVTHYLLLECLGRVPEVREGVARRRFNKEVMRGRISCERARAHAGNLVHRCIMKPDAVPARAVVRLIETFGLELQDFCFDSVELAREAIVRYTHWLLDDGKLTSAIGLILHFDLSEFGTIETLIILARSNEYALAQEFAQILDADGRRSWIEFCIVEGENEHSALRYAHRAVVAFNLETEFPDVRTKYFQSTIRRMIFKGQYEAALKHAGSEVDLQTTVIELLAEIGQLDFAHEFAVRCGLEFCCDPEALANLVAERRATYFQLPEHLQNAVAFADDESTLVSAVEKFILNQDVVGLDTEWGASVGEDSDKVDTGDVATLQLASLAGVVIIDIPKIQATCPHILERTLAPVFKSHSVLKLGFAVQEDLRRLAKAHSAFAEVNAVCDMQSLWKVGVSKAKASRLILDTPWGSKEESMRYQPIGLSTLTAVVLGKPLDKAMRMSDWSRRPLLPTQINYAALDAWTLVEAHRVIMESHRDIFSKLIADVRKSHVF